MSERLPELWYDAMGNYMFTALFDTKEEVDQFIAFVGEEDGR